MPNPNASKVKVPDKRGHEVMQSEGGTVAGRRVMVTGILADGQIQVTFDSDPAHSVTIPAGEFIAG